MWRVINKEFRSVSLLKFRESAVFPKYMSETSEGLCTKARDFKLMCLIDYNNYSEGTRCFAKLIVKRCKIETFLCVADDAKGWLKDVSLEVKKIALQKNRKIRCLLIKEYWGLFQGHLCLTSSDKVVFKKSMSILSISLGYQLKRRERRKNVVLETRCKIFRDNNHQSLYKKIKLFF